MEIGQPTVSFDTGAPDIGSTPAEKIATLRLAASEAPVHCQFWLGIYNPGIRAPMSLLETSNVDAMFVEALTQGVDGGGETLLLADCYAEPAKYVVLAPPPSEDFRDKAIWINKVSSFLQSCAPRSLGFCFFDEGQVKQSPLTSTTRHELMTSVIRQLLTTNATTDFYLATGKDGVNASLNIALQIKNELEQDALNFMVFH